MIQHKYLSILSHGFLRGICAVAVLAVVLAAGCADELADESLIADTRVLGAKVEIADDPTRAWPKPGESATALLLVVNPSFDFDFSAMQSMALTCTRAPFGNGEPICLELVKGLAQNDTGAGSVSDLGELFNLPGRVDCDGLAALEKETPELFALLPIGLACAQAEPQFRISVEAQPKADEKLLLGVTCDSGKAYLDPNDPALFGCDLDKGGRKQLWSLTVPLQIDRETNHHPALKELFLNGKTWARFDAKLLAEKLNSEGSSGDSTDCAQAVADGLIPEVRAGNSKVKIGIEGDGFESYRYQAETRQEQLWVSHYATSGDLQRAQSVLQESDKERVEVTWTAPKNPDKGGTLARFFFTLRDHRGGFDSTERALCVTNN